MTAANANTPTVAIVLISQDGVCYFNSPFRFFEMGQLIQHEHRQGNVADQYQCSVISHPVEPPQKPGANDPDREYSSSHLSTRSNTCQNANMNTAPRFEPTPGRCSWSILARSVAGLGGLLARR